MAKKKQRSRKKRAAASGAEVQQRRQERLEARRQARAEADAARRRRERRSRLIRSTVLAFLVAVVLWVLFLRPSSSPEAIAGHEIQYFDDSGLNQHVSEPVDYDTRPPVAGAHSPSLAPCGTYAETVPDERYVHALEHGAVGILYKPDTDPADVEAIEALVRDFDDKVLSQPYTDMPSQITVTSWGEMMRLDAFDGQAIRSYIETFRNQGPEPGAQCDIEVEESFEPPVQGDQGGD